jgi:hypothetical protein
MAGDSLLGSPMVLPNIENLPPEVDATVRSAIASEFPDRVVSHTRIAESSQQGVVVRVFLLSLRGLKPPPYMIYRVDLPSMVVRRLSGDEAALYKIANYK